jgi:hypothetical protein
LLPAVLLLLLLLAAQQQQQPCLTQPDQQRQHLGDKWCCGYDATALLLLLAVAGLLGRWLLVVAWQPAGCSEHLLLLLHNWQRQVCL